MGILFPFGKKDKNQINTMSKKFTEYSQLNLSEVNKEVLKKWDENDVFNRSMTEREGHPSFVFMKDLLQQMVCRVFTT